MSISSLNLNFTNKHLELIVINSKELRIPICEVSKKLFVPKEELKEIWEGVKEEFAFMRNTSKSTWTKDENRVLLKLDCEKMISNEILSMFPGRCCSDIRKHKKNLIKRRTQYLAQLLELGTEAKRLEKEKVRSLNKKRKLVSQKDSELENISNNSQSVMIPPLVVIPPSVLSKMPFRPILPKPISQDFINVTPRTFRVSNPSSDAEIERKGEDAVLLLSSLKKTV
ncbi:MAG: hypothetical protein WC222_11895 [Parachlamydiales bacterium]|jgi:hypothetical protein